MIRRRPKKEVLAYYDGAINAYKMLLKVWPVSKEGIQGFMVGVQGLRQTEEGHDSTDWSSK